MARGAQHGHDVAQRLALLGAGDDLLQHPDAGAALALPVLRVLLHALEAVEGLGGPVEGARAVAVIRDELQQHERVRTRIEVEVELPGLARLAVHDVAARQPRDIAEVARQLAALHEQQRLLGLAVIANGRERQAKVPLRGERACGGVARGKARERASAGRARRGGRRGHQSVDRRTESATAGGRTPSNTAGGTRVKVVVVQ